MPDSLVMPLDEFVGRFAPMGNGLTEFGTWDDVVSNFLSNEDDRAVVQHLRKHLAAGRSFHSPVRVDLEDSGVENGLHRVVASMLEGAATISYVTGDSPGIPFHIDVTAHCPSGVLPIREGDEDFAETLVATLWSFPVGDAWFTCDGFSCGSHPSPEGLQFGCWGVVENVDELDLATLHRLISDRLSSQLAIVVDAVEEFIVDSEDEETG